MTMHRIWLERVVCGDGTVLEAAWQGPLPERDVNSPLWGRTKDVRMAMEFSREETIRRVMDYRDHGYPCRADPPITLHI